MEHTGQRGFNFITAFHPRGSNDGLYTFDCIKLLESSEIDDFPGFSFFLALNSF